MLNAPKVSDKTIKRIMAETDDADHERRRIKSENDRNRLIAEMSLLPHSFCHLRRCRRSKHCEGPAVHTLHRFNRVRAQLAIGLSGAAYKTLPQCLSDMSKEQYETTCRPFDSDTWPDRLSPELRSVIKSQYKYFRGYLLQRDHGIRLGWKTTQENYNSEYDAVMRVIRRPLPKSEPDIPQWLVKLDWKPDTVLTSLLEKIDVLSGRRGNQCQGVFPKGQTVIQDS